MIGRIILLLAASTIVLVAALAQTPVALPPTSELLLRLQVLRLRASCDPQKCSHRPRRTSGSGKIEL